MFSFGDPCCHVRKLKLNLGAVTELDFQPRDGAFSQSQNLVVGQCCISKTSAPHWKVENAMVLA